MSQTKVFSSPELEQAYARAQSGLANYKARLDGISNDIKTLEKAFEASQFNVATWVTVSSYCEGAKENGSVDQISHQLGWASTGDRFRLMYRRLMWEGYMEVCEGVALTAPGEYGSNATEFEKPLIETPVQTRLEMHEHLPKLVIAIGAAADPKLADEVSKEKEDSDLKALEALDKLTEMFRPKTKAAEKKKEQSESAAPTKPADEPLKN